MCSDLSMAVCRGGGEGSPGSCGSIRRRTGKHVVSRHISVSIKPTIYTLSLVYKQEWFLLYDRFSDI